VDEDDDVGSALAKQLLTEYQEETLDLDSLEQLSTLADDDDIWQRSEQLPRTGRGSKQASCQTRTQGFFHILGGFGLLSDSSLFHAYSHQRTLPSGFNPQLK
jgi:hypothetical protein